MIDLYLPAIIETLLMTLIASGFAFLFGGILGIILVLTKPGGLKENKLIYKILDVIVNVLRSVPFVILMVFLLPYTRMLVRTTIGIWGTIPPLTLAAIPFIGRLVENVLNNVDGNLIEMAKSLGASPFQILKEVLLVESRPALIQNGAVAMVTILGYGAMAGFTGGGGLGVVAINYGYHRNQSEIMLWAIICLIVIVQVIEFIGNRWAKQVNKKN